MLRTFLFAASAALTLTAPHAYAGGAYSDPLAAQLHNDRGDREAIVRDLNGYINNRGASEEPQPSYEQPRYPALPDDRQ